MRDRPAGVSDRDFCTALADGWSIDVAAARYAPVGGGSYHWIELPPDERNLVVDMLAALHRTAPARVQLPPHQVGLTADAEHALRALEITLAAAPG